MKRSRLNKENASCDGKTNKCRKPDKQQSDPEENTTSSSDSSDESISKPSESSISGTVQKSEYKWKIKTINAILMKKLNVSDKEVCSPVAKASKRAEKEDVAGIRSVLADSIDEYNKLEGELNAMHDNF